VAGKLGRPFERGVEIRGVDGEPADVFFAFGERAIRYEELPVLHSHESGCAVG
jgi:hypothetical protein